MQTNAEGLIRKYISHKIKEAVYFLRARFTMANDKIYRDLSKRIREYRRASGITQEEFGAAASLSSRRVRDIEAGKAQGLSLSALVRIAEELGCELRLVEKDQSGNRAASGSGTEYDDMFNGLASGLTAKRDAGWRQES